MPQARTPMVTLLFTDLVNSTALLQRAGDEQAQRVFRVHHRLLKEAVAANGGHTVKWLGDGLMVAFPSAADAVRCAVAMQQASRRPIAGERLVLRVGLNTGEALRDETDYFGMPVVVARRLCEHARGGQILCSTVLSGLLAGRPAFAFRDCGTVELKGLAAPIATCEVIYEHDEPTQTPFATFDGTFRSDIAAAVAGLDETHGLSAVDQALGEPPSTCDPRRLAYEIGAAFAEKAQLAELLPFAVAKCREMLRAEGVGVLFLDQQRNELYFPYVASEDPAVAARLLDVRFPADRGIAGTVLRSGASMRIDNASADPRFFGGVDRDTGRVTRALLCAPFTSQRGVCGVIEAVNPCGAEAFSDDDLALLDAFAGSLAAALDNLEGTGQLPEPPRTATDTDVFRKDGDYWTLAFEGRVVRLKDAKGLHYINHLLRHPGQEFHARDLMTLVGSGAVAAAPPSPDVRADQLTVQHGLGNAGALLDAKAKADYKRRLDDLREELEEAERFNDPGRVGRARQEMEFITNQLAATIGLGGRDRVAVSDAERARLAVTKRIKAALVKIRDANPMLARHLSAAITTGYFCRYAPTVDALTSWIVG